MASYGTKKNPKFKIHEFTVKVRFDRPCTEAHALQEAANNLNCEFYLTNDSYAYPDKMAVVKVTKKVPEIKFASFFDGFSDYELQKFKQRLDALENNKAEGK